MKENHKVDGMSNEGKTVRRIFLEIAYDGTCYHGFAFQDNEKTIEGTIIDAIEQLTGEKTEVIGASRTDTGVHAYCNVAVFDTGSSIPPERFSNALNTKLPADIRITKSFEVSSDFHPRKRKTEKTYEYRIMNTDIEIPTDRLYTYHCSYRLDEKKMNEAAQYLIGEHDFSSFCSAGAQVLSHVRTIRDIDVERKGSLVIIRVRGNGFLYNMVRIIAGTLMDVGRGKIAPEDMITIIEKRDRSAAGPTAPPQGLFLVNSTFDMD
ncbi:tRNA pseudouridine(38-40) synthase TruA [Butyrivibrio sp. NC2002]|uniref:tRNA pseudouridine(38-40) synthase TruA n=1 Tax=Butyrivibrio sp. NC2002 TaxID=1410610 RepID=UPI000AD5990B|nr:tRNA pseudouridine(38-40) synthase TruA [Butyrivibrio sp. NC2002]